MFATTRVTPPGGARTGGGRASSLVAALALVALSSTACELESYDGSTSGGPSASSSGASSSGASSSGASSSGASSSGASSSGASSSGASSSGASSSGASSSGASSSGASSSGASSSGASSSGASSSGGQPARCAGKPGRLRGFLPAQRVDVHGTSRLFTYYAPKGLDPDEPVPLIIAAHGDVALSNDLDMYNRSGFKQIADREGLVVVFPLAIGGRWNIGADVSWVPSQDNATADDQGFVDALVAYAKADQCIDDRHVFVAGFALGGYFASEDACLRSDVAAIAAHAGGTHDLAGCAGPVRPVILFHGDADATISYEFAGVVARNRWAARNGCGTGVDSRPIRGGACEYNQGCPAHAQVALCRYNAMPHVWAGTLDDGSWGPGSVSSAAELAWSFWRQHAW